MRTMQRVGRWIALVVAATGAALASGGAAWGAEALDNGRCLACHGSDAKKIEVPGPGDKPRALKTFAPDAITAGEHGKLQCVSCHTGVTDNPEPGGTHKKDSANALKSASCPDCHQRLWDEAVKNKTAADMPRLRKVIDNMEAYKKSFHARPSKSDASKPLAQCDNCHDTHSFHVPPPGGPAHVKWRQSIPGRCGTDCHTDQLETYTDSVHGKEVLGKANAKAATCADCHTSHSISNTSGEPFKLAVTATCGTCHEDMYKSYKETYHGQISTLGYGFTAKCYNCHGSHGVQRVKDPASKAHPDNRLETCKECHNGKKAVAAPASFASFQPHATTHDFARYPQVWLAFKLMVGLLVGTFGFFWTHTALWFYREYKDRKAMALRPRVKAEAVAGLEGKHFRRFTGLWRIAHITFALSLMTLTLTGMPLFYPEASWAPWVMKLLGGPRTAGTIHRVAAVIFAGVFFWHLVYVAMYLWRHRKTFRIFGPTSLVPGLQDLKDIIAMFRWFFGLGPRPVFDRWTYWEKFDYWAPFWGVTIIGGSGLVMWLPSLTGTLLPGWVFNIAAIFHGEEAFLAVVFLFTVHFFNNHFRPEKFPVDVVMFTGTLSLEHVMREHPLEYQRLKDSGELDKYIVDAPSAPMTLASKLLGFTLIAIGLTLLFGVAIGFFSGH